MSPSLNKREYWNILNIQREPIWLLLRIEHNINRFIKILTSSDSDIQL